MSNTAIEKRTKDLLETITNFQKAFKEKNDLLIYKFIQEESELKERLGLSDSEVVEILKPNVVKYIKSLGNFSVVDDLLKPDVVHIQIGDWYGAYTFYSLDILTLQGGYYNWKGSVEAKQSPLKVCNRLKNLIELGREGVLADIKDKFDVESDVLELEKHRISSLKDKIKDNENKSERLVVKERELSEQYNNTLMGKKKIQSSIDNVRYELGILAEEIASDKRKLYDLKQREKAVNNKAKNIDIEDIISEAKVNLIYDSNTLDVLNKAGFKDTDEAYNWIKNFKQIYLGTFTGNKKFKELKEKDEVGGES